MIKKKIIVEEIETLKHILNRGKKNKEIPYHTKKAILHSISVIETILWIRKGTPEYHNLYRAYNKVKTKQIRKDCFKRKKARGECVDCSEPATIGIRCWYHSFMNALNKRIKKNMINGG